MTEIIGSIDFTVPRGNQAIVRGIQLIPGLALMTASATEGTLPVFMLLDFFFGGGGVNHNTDQKLFLLPGSNTYPLFFVLPTEATFKVRLRQEQSTFTTTATGYDVAIIVHGNLILSDDRPTDLVVSTERGLL